MGPLTYGRSPAARFAGLDFGEPRPFSEDTARAIDEDVRALVAAEYARAEAILIARRDMLTRIAHELIARETLEQGDLHAMLNTAEAAE